MEQLIACTYGAAQLTRLSHPPGAIPRQNAPRLPVRGHEEWCGQTSIAGLHERGQTW